jgi:protein-disulfide isomerase
MIRPDHLNRLVFFLACVGGFIALSIGIVHAAGGSLPCGEAPQGGISPCDAVAQDSWSRVAGIPIAFLGFGLYLAVALLALLRDAIGCENSTRMGAAMWAALAVGTITHLVLLLHAANEIRASCIWCIASGITMGVALVVQTVAMAYRPEPKERAPRFAPMVVGLLFAVAAGSAYGGYIASTTKLRALAIDEVKLDNTVELIRDSTSTRGPVDAPLTVVEFSDLHCPSCRKNHDYLRGVMEGRLKGKIRHAFRHYPFSNLHPNATRAAMLAEWAKSKGKFWEFVDLMYENQDKSSADDMIALLASLGLPTDEPGALIQDPQKARQFLQPVLDDMIDGRKLDVNSTPTWYVTYPNGETLSGAGDAISLLLAEDEIEQRSK